MSESLPRSRGDMYAINALKHKRASIASEIVQLERQLRHRKDMLVHVDATLRLLDPTIEVDSIPPKRPPQRIKLFRQGELGRMIVDALRRAEVPLSLHDLVSLILAAGGHGEEARRTVAPRVRGNLAYLAKQSKVQKSNGAAGALWSIPQH